MTIEHVVGDLFAQDVQAIGHGVNCYGEMGAGIAVVFRRGYPAMYDEYRRRCEAGEFGLGSILAWKTKSGKAIYNLGTQFQPGRNASLEGIRWSVTRMLAHAELNDIGSVALPQIGCGIGGLSWNEVRNLLEGVAERSAVHLVTVTLPE